MCCYAKISKVYFQWIKQDTEQMVYCATVYMDFVFYIYTKGKGGIEEGVGLKEDFHFAFKYFVL